MDTNNSREIEMGPHKQSKKLYIWREWHTCGKWPNIILNLTKEDVNNGQTII